MCIDKLDDNKYNDAHHSAMKPVDLKSSTYINFNKENKKIDPKSEVADHVRISKNKKMIKLQSKLKWISFCD